MEKGTPHYSLERICRLVEAGAYWVTLTAQQNADRDFGLDTPERIAPYILSLTRRQFHKSMTAYRDHRIWQDVYYSDVDGVPAYIKLQINAEDESVVISFKRRDTG